MNPISYYNGDCRKEFPTRERVLDLVQDAALHFAGGELMRRSFFFLLGVVFSGAGAGDEFPVDYEITGELNPHTHRLQGAERIRWTNMGGVPTSELWFHLYLNAFAGDRTTFMRGMGEGTLRGGREIDREWGWTRVISLRSEDGIDLLPSLTFERPDDGNPEDFTVARVLLERPVEPGASVTVDVTFEAQLPRVIARTGWAGDFHLIGQWFPKLGVYEAEGHGGRAEAGWNCHQFHPATEFYSDFGRYRVQLTVPEDFVVGATGVQMDERTVAEGTARKRTLTFTADRVHDFVWCAAPADLMAVIESDFDPGRDVPAPWLQRAQSLLDLSAAELELPPVHLRLLVPHTQMELGDRMLRGARLGMAWYGLFYGAYPYPQLTLVSPPPGAEEAAGMEYPTFITTGATKLLEYPPVSWLGINEGVTVHEFGHQYFQGMLASNEFEQAWLDEGLNTYADTSCMEAISNDRLVPEIRISGSWASKRLSWALRNSPVQVDREAWKFRTRRDYGTASYKKTALVLKTLEGLLGPDVFARAMRSYVDAWRFRHPTGDDFCVAISESAGEDLGWFFAQALEGDAIVDWAVEDVVQREKTPAEGMIWDGGRWVGPAGEQGDPGDDDAAGEPEAWDIHADIMRRGDFQGPVEVLFLFDEGREERRMWAGQDRWVRFEFVSSERLVAVVVDPEGVWALEGERTNNYWRDQPDSGAATHRLWWAPAAMRLIALAVQPWS